MSDQRMRLIAELKDNMSSGLKLINKELKQTRRTQGMEQVGKWFGGFAEQTEKFARDGAGVAGIMGSIGLGGIAAAAGLSGLVEQFKQLGDHTFAMKRLGQQTGMTVNQIARWDYIGQRFRLSTEQMEGALHHYGDAMADFMRRRGELFGQLNQQDPGETDKLLGIKDPNERVKEILRWLGTIKDVAIRDRWATAFFGAADIDAVLTNGLPAFLEAVGDAAAQVYTLTAEQQRQADDLNKSILAFDQAWNDLKLDVGGTVFTQLKQAADDFRATFEEIKPIIDWMKGEQGKSAGAIAGDVAGLAKDAIDRRARENQNQEDRATRAGGPNEKIIFDLPSAASKVIHGFDPAPFVRSQGNNGDPGLHRYDEAPLPKSKGWFGGLFGGKVDKTAFTTFDDEGLGTGGIGGSAGQDVLAAGVKEGVLAAFREWAQQGAAQAGGAGVGGLISASYETGMGGGRRSHGEGGGVYDGKLYSGPKDSASVQEHVAFIKQAAAALGIDPNYAVRVANSEGLHSFYGDHGTSFGDFQLHIGNHIPGLSLGGLGDAYRRATGHDPSDPHNWREMDVFALKEARRGGWGPWHGAAHIGIFGHAGMGLPPSGKLPDTNPQPSLAEETRRAAAGSTPSRDGSIEAHIHLHDGRKAGVTAKSSGAVKPPQVTIRRGPTMTQPDYQA